MLINYKYLSFTFLLIAGVSSMISAVKELGDNNTTDSFYKEAIIIFLFLLTSLIFAVLYGGEYIRKTKRAIAEKNYEDEDEVSPKKTKDTEEESEDS